MINKPTIALCIPAFNAAAYLEDLLQSAHAQESAFAEILVYNDCSTDNTVIIAEKNGATIFSGEKNMGCSYGKNFLAKNAKSEWLHFHDADDLLLPNFTKVAASRISAVNAPDILLMHYHYLDFETKKFLNEPSYNREALTANPTKFSIENKIVNFAVIRKSAFLRIEGFDTDPRVLYNEDRAFYTKAAIEGLSFDYEREVTSINYLYHSSMSAQNIEKCAAAAYEVWFKVIAKTGESYNKEIAAQLLENANYAATANAWGVVRDSVKKSVEIYPAIKPAGSNLFKILFKLMPVHSYRIRKYLLGLRK